MSTKITTTHRLECPMNDLTAGEIREFLLGVDDSAKLKIRTAYGLGPGEISTVTIEAEVDISKGRIY